MNVYLLWTWFSYEDRVLVGVYTSREVAESALPGARWVDGKAMHPVYDVPWHSPHFDDAEIEIWTVSDTAIVQAEPPEGPRFGPPTPPRCPVYDGGPYMRCSRITGHSGDHTPEPYFAASTSDWKPLVYVPESDTVDIGEWET